MGRDLFGFSPDPDDHNLVIDSLIHKVNMMEDEESESDSDKHITHEYPESPTSNLDELQSASSNFLELS